jgi:hypothetical protein
MTHLTPMLSSLDKFIGDIDHYNNGFADLPLFFIGGKANNEEFLPNLLVFSNWFGKSADIRWIK